MLLATTQWFKAIPKSYLYNCYVHHGICLNKGEATYRKLWLLGAYLLTTYTYKRMRLLTRVYGIFWGSWPFAILCLWLGFLPRAVAAGLVSNWTTFSLTRQVVSCLAPLLGGHLRKAADAAAVWCNGGYSYMWNFRLASEKHRDQEQRTAPRRSQVGVAPEVTWHVGVALRSLGYVGGAQYNQQRRAQAWKRG